MQKTTISLLVYICLTFNIYAQEAPKDYTDFEWTVHTLSEGLTWKHCLYDSLHPEPQSINVLIINPKFISCRLGFAFLTDARKTTDELAQSADAIAAINGTFFNMASGGSVCFLKVNDTVRNYSQQDLRSYIHEGAIAIDDHNQVNIISRPDSGWAKSQNYKDVMSSGPLLIEQGKIALFEEDKFNQNRHPRTGIGITEKGHILWVTVDGRHSRARGMSIPEFARLMEFLSCQKALNLDGGGSTTMYIKGQSTNGIVNYPSDNKIFDHMGQRTVSNIVFLTIP